MIYISLGSNLGNRFDNLRRAAKMIERRCLNDIAYSIVLETKAILAKNSSQDWDKPYLNMIISGKTELSPRKLLDSLKAIEAEIGRKIDGLKWAPRLIDLDILLYNNLVINEIDLQIPHSELQNREFFQHLLTLMSSDKWRQQKNITDTFFKSYVLWPELIGVLNITPDSFSDGGRFDHLEKAVAQFVKLSDEGASIIEIGAQSTRPNATMQSMTHENEKLSMLLNEIAPLMKERKIKISIDSFNGDIIRYLLSNYQIDIVNDVSGMLDDETLRQVIMAGSRYCVMHSVCIPPRASDIIPTNMRPLDYLLHWGKLQISRLLKLGFNRNDIILDPGVGFGKTFYQNIDILQNIDELKSLNTLVMMGHSRKSYISAFSLEGDACDRDVETISLSLALQSKVDFLRVHNVRDHMKALVSSNIYGA